MIKWIKVTDKSQSHIVRNDKISCVSLKRGVMSQGERMSKMAGTYTQTLTKGKWLSAQQCHPRRVQGRRPRDNCSLHAGEITRLEAANLDSEILSLPM